MTTGPRFQPYRLVTSVIRQSHTWPPSVGDRAFSRHGVDLPWPGWWKLRLVRKGPWVPLRIWVVEHRCPETGALMSDPEYIGQRGLDEPSSCWDWQFRDLGIDLTTISRADYDYLMRLLRHAQEREPDLPEAQPHRAVDWLNSAPVL